MIGLSSRLDDAHELVAIRTEFRLGFRTVDTALCCWENGNASSHSRRVLSWCLCQRPLYIFVDF